MTKDIVVPALGESITEATVAQWYKKEGDAVEEDEPIVELETDKVTVEVNAPAAGVLGKIAFGEDSAVEVGAVLGSIEVGKVAAPKKETVKAEAAAEAPAATTTAAPAPAPTAAPAGNNPNLSPAVRKLVAESNVNPQSIQGTGKDGRLTKGDVLGHLKSGNKPTTIAEVIGGGETAPVQAGPREEVVKMSRLRQRIAERLKEAQNTAAMLTTFNEVDMTNVMALRSQYKDLFEKKYDARLGFMSFFVKAAIGALKEIPAINAEIRGTDVVYKNFYDIGVAVGTPKGLVVPVLRDADQRNFAEIEQGIYDLAIKARDGKLAMDEMTGGTFTITNGGVYGSLMSTPIINSPQSGILGMHSIQKRPCVVGDEIKIRPMMYIALSYDHRIVDGREAVTFLVKIKEYIEDPQRLLLNV